MQPIQVLKNSSTPPVQDQLQDGPDDQPPTAPLTAGAPLMPPTPSDGYEPSTAPDINQELPPVPEDDDDFMKEPPQLQPSDVQTPLVQQQPLPLPAPLDLEHQPPHHNHVK